MYFALIAAALFGASSPLCKALLPDWGPVSLAGALYFSSGLGLLALRPLAKSGDPLRRADLGWLFGSIVCGGMLAPAALLFGLRLTTGYAGALLLNLETLFTAAIAVGLFGERLRRPEVAALVILLAGAAAVALGTAKDRTAERPVLGAILVAAACLGWGFDNNFTQRISGRDPMQIASVKGLAAGAANLGLGQVAGENFPLDAAPLAGTAAVGLFSYGVSLVCFVLALRKLGAARTGALFATAPVSGVLVAWLALGETPGWAVLAGGAAMLAGVLLMALAPAKAVTRES